MLCAFDHFVHAVGGGLVTVPCVRLGSGLGLDLLELRRLSRLVLSVVVPVKQNVEVSAPVDLAFGYGVIEGVYMEVGLGLVSYGLRD